MRGATLLLTLTLSLTALAGCTTAPDDAGDAVGTTDPYAAAAALFPVDNSGSGCDEGFVGGLVSFEQAAKHLPAGFKPADAQVMLETPVPTEQAVAFFTTFDCSTSTYTDGTLVTSDLGVLVQAPQVTGLVEPAMFNFYVFETYASNAQLVAALNATGYRVVDSTPTLSFEALPSGSATAEASFTDAEDRTVTYTVRAPVPDRMTGLARFWHDAPGGLVYSEYLIDDQPIAQGGATCTLPDGSMAAKIFGRTDCPAESTIAMTLNDVSWTSRYVFLPGERATA